MPLTIGQIRALIESFNAEVTAHAVRLTLSLEFETDFGESIITSHSYQLEGIHPEKEVSTAQTETLECAACGQKFQSIGGNLVCWNCYEEPGCDDGFSEEWD